MLKFLRSFALTALLLLPFVTQAQQALPYSYGFENNDLSASGWTLSGSTSSSTGIYNSSSAAQEGSYLFRFNYEEESAYLVSPVLSGTENGVNVSFYYTQYSSSYAEEFQVGYTTDATVTDPTLFTYGSSIETESTDWALYEGTFPAGTKRIAIKYIYTDAFYLYLDNFSFVTPPSCVKPSGLAVSGVTSSSLTLTWTSDATNFIVCDTANDDTYNVAANTYTVTDLDANTEYTFGVVTDCGGGDISDTVWVTGRTACEAIEISATNLFSEGFEGETFPPSCWTTAHTAGASSSLWIRNTTSSYIHEGSGSAKLPDQNSGNKTNLVTPLFNIPTANEYQITFWMNRVSSSKPLEGVKVWVNTTPDTIGGTPLMHIRRGYAMGEITESAAGWYSYSAPIPTSGDVYIIFEGISEYGNASYIDDVSIEEAPSCLPVTLLSIDATQTTTSSLTLTWTSDATSFVVFDTTDADNSDIVSTNTYTFDNLDANTEYTFGVYVDCGAGDVSDTLYVTGRTACGAIASVPWSDGMEAVPAGSNQMPFCWTRYNNLTSGYNYYPYSYSYSSYAHEGNRSLYFSYSTYGTYADTAIAILPQIDENSLTLSDLQLTLWARSNTAIDVQVGTMSDPADPTTFVVEDTVTVDGTTYTRFDVNLDDAPVANTYAAIMVLNPSAYVSLYIDDVSLQEIPSCAYVTNLTVENITAEGATLSWHGEADGYTIYNMADATVEGTATDTTYTLTGLTASTEYTFGVAANCGSDESEIINVTFRTACGAVELPYTETFASTSTTRDCWNLVSNNTINASSSTTSSNYMGFVTYSGHSVMVFNSWSSASDYYQYGYSPVLDASGLTEADSIHIRVVYSSHGEDDPLYFGYTTAASTTPTDYTWVGPFYTDGYDAWASLEANLPLDVVQLAVHYASTGCNYKAYVDSVEVTGYVIPSCPAPTGLAASNITAEGATLTWNGEATGYTVYDMTDTSVVGTATEATYALTDLTANTQYTYGVAAICGSDESEIVTVTFTTACGAVAIPFTEDFENGINCWTMVSTATNTGVAANSSYTTVAYSGTHAFKFAYNTNPPQYLISPELNGTEDGVKVSFMYKAGGSYSESFALGYSTTTNDVTAFTWNTEVTGITNNEFETYSAILPVDVKYVSVKYTANDQLALYIDSMVFEEAPSCLPVAELTLDTATATSATISWTGTADSYSIYNGTTFVENVTDNSYTFNGLSAATSYTFGVVAVCSATDSAEMVTIHVVTDCANGSCNITIATGEYGFLGASIDVMQNGGLVANVTDASYEAYTESVSVCSGVPVTLVFNSGGYYDEYVTFTVADGAGTVVYTCSDGSTLTDGATFTTINDPCPSCMPVTDLAVDTATENSITISWTGTAASYSVYYGSTFVENVTDNSYTFTGLTAATGYTFGVVAVCSATDSAAMATIAASTACAVISTFPYTQDFSAAPACWTTIDADGDGYNWAIPNGYSSIQSASYQGGVLTPDNWLITPQFAIPATGAYEVTWSATAQDQDWPSEHYGIYVSTTTADSTANFTLIQEWTLTTGIFNPVIDLSEYAGQNIYLAFRHFNCTDMFRISIDDFVVRQQAGANQVVINVNQNNPAYGSVTGAGTYNIGDTVTVTATANDSYVFNRWVDTANATVSTDNPYTFVAATNLTLKAMFLEASATTYTVIVEVNDSTMGTATGGGSYVSGEVATLVATPNEGYHFVNWTHTTSFGITELSTDATTTVTVTSDKTYTANFAVDSVPPVVVPTYTVTVNVNDTAMGTVTGAPTAPVDSASVVVLTATANEGYHFVNWTDASAAVLGTSATLNLTVTADMTITANFAENAVGVTHTVTVNVNDETMGTATGAGEYADGETAVLVATANDGYHFVSWSNGETTDTIRVVVLSDTTLTATFAEDVNVYTVTVYYDETMGTVTGAGEYEEGATATLTATANEGYVFTGWSNGETDSIITITVTENVTLTANFAAVTGIEDVEGAEAVVYATDNKIVVKGAEGMSIYVFDVNGRVMSREANAAEQTEFVMPTTGIYLVKVGEAAAKRVVVMR